MPLVYDIEESTGFVVINAIKRIGTDEYIETWKTAVADDRAPRCPRILVDLTGVEIHRTGHEVRAAAAGSKRFFESIAGGRLALVATQQVSFGIARMYDALVQAEGFELQIFRDVDTARAWLAEGR